MCSTSHSCWRLRLPVKRRLYRLPGSEFTDVIQRPLLTGHYDMSLSTQRMQQLLLIPLGLRNSPGFEG
jgi:hypothetical protein